jgi:hypothetical protein
MVRNFDYVDACVQHLFHSLARTRSRTADFAMLAGKWSARPKTDAGRDRDHL